MDRDGAGPRAGPAQACRDHAKPSGPWGRGAADLEEYRRDRFRQKGTERLLQEIVDASADANLHLVRALGQPAPSDYYNSFVQMGVHGVIRDSLARRLAPAAGLRNRLVHEYEAIDDAIVLGAVAGARRDFAEYVAAVEAYLGRDR